MTYFYKFTAHRLIITVHDTGTCTCTVGNSVIRYNHGGRNISTSMVQCNKQLYMYMFVFCKYAFFLLCFLLVLHVISFAH